jgi:ketosteroid isomerase-like protein
MQQRYNHNNSLSLFITITYYMFTDSIWKKCRSDYCLRITPIASTIQLSYKEQIYLIGDKFMKMSLSLRILTAIIALILGSTLASAASGGPEDTVNAFNEGFSAKDKDAVIATLAEGGAQFTLRSQHEDAPPENLQSEITAYWTLIAPVLFASTSSYQREIEITEAKANGDIATVWTNSRIKSTRLGSDEATISEFTEVYLLIKTADGWKIAAIGDNRQATKLADE